MQKCSSVLHVYLTPIQWNIGYTTKLRAAFLQMALLLTMCPRLLFMHEARQAESAALPWTPAGNTNVLKLLDEVNVWCA